MIKILPESEGNMLAIEASGKLTDADYKEILIPRIEEVIKAHGKARMVFYMDSQFEGWKPTAMWDDAKLGLKHRKHFEKLAVVGGPKYAKWGTKFSAHFMSGEVKTFEPDQLLQAEEWAKA